MAENPELAAALKMCKAKQMYFAFIPKGPADGALIIKKAKIPAKEIAAAKKEVGGGKAIIGRCEGPVTEMVFTTAKAVPGSMATAIKIITKRDAGIPVKASFQTNAELAADEEDTGAEDTTGASSAAEPPPAPTAPEAGADTETPEDEAQEGEADLSEWKAAVEHAASQLKELAKKVAGTRHESAKGVLGEINSIIKDISKLPANPTNEQIESHQDFISSHDGIAAAEEFPGEFHDLKIREKLIKALNAAKKSTANA